MDPVGCEISRMKLVRYRYRQIELSTLSRTPWGRCFNQLGYPELFLASSIDGLRMTTGNKRSRKRGMTFGSRTQQHIGSLPLISPPIAPFFLSFPRTFNLPASENSSNSHAQPASGYFTCLLHAPPSVLLEGLATQRFLDSVIARLDGRTPGCAYCTW